MPNFIPRVEKNYDNAVYDPTDVVDEGQSRIGTCWVVTPKKLNGKEDYKARLVSRGIKRR